MSSLPTFADVQAAARRLDGITLRTPLLENARVNASLGGRLFIKAECLQRTGSFKLRGAYNFLSLMSEAERKKGVVGKFVDRERNDYGDLMHDKFVDTLGEEYVETEACSCQ